MFLSNYCAPDIGISYSLKLLRAKILRILQSAFTVACLMVLLDSLGGL